MPRHFPNWLKAYMTYTCDSESPDDFHFWTGVSTIAGALRARCWIDMRKFRWTPNFYIILVGPAGIVTKSTSTRAGLRLLEQVDHIHFGPPSTTWQALTKALSGAIEHVKIGTDKNGNDKTLPMSCLTISISELGTFLKMEEKGLVDVITDLWDGQLSTWRHETATTGQTEIRNPWLNVIGCTTPSWMRNNVPEHAIGGGLLSRVIFVFGDHKRQLVPYPDEVMPIADYALLEQKLIEDLKDIGAMVGEFHLTPEARDWGRKWYANHWNGTRTLSMASDRYEGYIARKQTHMHKLAIILSAARSSSLIIEASHLQEAEQLLGSVEVHMLKAFESVGVVDEARHVAEIAAFVKAHKILTSDELWALVMNLMPRRDFEEALSSAIHGGLLKISPHPTKTYDEGPKRGQPRPAVIAVQVTTH